jgi:hypothetical protein
MDFKIFIKNSLNNRIKFIQLEDQKSTTLITLKQKLLQHLTQNFKIEEVSKEYTIKLVNQDIKIFDSLFDYQQTNNEKTINDFNIENESLLQLLFEKANPETITNLKIITTPTTPVTNVNENVTNNSTTSNVSVVEKKENNVENAEDGKCKIHKGENIICFCSDHNVFCCGICLLDFHYSHNIIKIFQLKNQILGFLKNENFNEKKNNLLEQKNEIEIVFIFFFLKK